ncbi:MAG: hypothetical protein D6735_00975 [Acidobacteria bacterium]|nr:MAG: hypothetical protein D6735_00975 [Acidobacteriota bacterium]
MTFEYRRTIVQSKHPSKRNLPSPCSLHCGYTGKSINQVSSNFPCSACVSTRIIRGKLFCSSCGADYPIEDGIPNSRRTNDYLGK